MKILYIIPYIPYPLDSGGNQAFFNMVDAVRKQHDVSLLLYVHHHQQDAVKKLSKVWNNVELLCYSNRLAITSDSQQIQNGCQMSKKHEMQCRLFEYIQHSMERKIARRRRKYEHQESRLHKFSLSQFVRENSVLFSNATDLNDDFLNYVYTESHKGYDLIQVEFFEYLPLIYVLPSNVQTVFVHHELRYVRVENEMSLWGNVSAFDKMLYGKQKDAEISMLSKYNHIIVLTETDKALLAESLPEKHIYVSPALTNAGKEGAQKSFLPCRDLVFVGGGDHFPNADGVLWFCTEVVPELKKMGEMPNLYVVGKWGNSIKKIIQYIYPDVQFMGFVDDLGDFINGKISVVPIRIGSGMRMKILDTISAKAPLVTTSKGCEGLPFVDGKDCLISDSATDFAKNINRLVNDVKLQECTVESSSNKLHSILDSKKLLATRMAFYDMIAYGK